MGKNHTLEEKNELARLWYEAGELMDEIDAAERRLLGDAEEVIERNHNGQLAFLAYDRIGKIARGEVEGVLEDVRSALEEMKGYARKV